MLPSPSGFLAEAISLYKILAWTDNPDFIDQTWRKKVFPIKKEKVNTTIVFRLFELV